MVAQLDAIRVIPSPPKQVDEELTVQRLNITNALQTTLELEHLFYLFSEQIRALIPHDGYHYYHPSLKQTVDYGITTRNSCYAELHLNSADYGLLVLYRRKAFSSFEMNALDSLAACLVYPLRNITQYQQALQAAHTDALTQIPNRRALSENLRRECILSRRQNSPLSLILMDLDHFKYVNDKHGHEEGDRLLIAVAQLLKQCVRSSDIVYRYGGEEFVILLSHTPISGASLLAERIRSKLETYSGDSLQSLPVTASLGVATYNTREDAKSLLNRADKAMYAAKMMGRNRIEIG
jgi:diguanylate cyclase (GGDEF)-like protein